jgi:hypothetical protein
VAVDFLAFYQTAAFGEEKWRIQHVAAVKGHELTTRGELLRDEPDHPHAKHEYYKIQIGPLQQLPEPVLSAGWHRITFFYTTGEYLLAARTIEDLILAEDDRRPLWQALRERATRTQSYTAELPEIGVDSALLAAILGIADENAH